MTFFRDLFADLVNKRLLPVAIALLVAAVAVPVLLSSGEPASDPAATRAAQEQAAKAAADASAAQPIVAVQATGTTNRKLTGLSRKDPFKQQHVPKVATTPTDSTSGSTTPSSGDTGSSGGSGHAGGSGGSGGSGDTGGGSAPKTYTTYKVDVTFGEAGATKSRKDVPRLSPLPNSSDPIVIFLGVSRTDKQTRAVFLVTSDAVATGDGACKPKDDACTYVYLAENETQYFDVQTGTAGLAQYELTVKDIKVSHTTSQSAALKRYARESRAGREILRAEAGRTRALRYDRTRGVITARVAKQK
jgi:hypothetical protein